MVFLGLCVLGDVCIWLISGSQSCSFHSSPSSNSPKMLCSILFTYLQLLAHLLVICLAVHLVPLFRASSHQGCSTNWLLGHIGLDNVLRTIIMESRSVPLIQINYACFMGNWVLVMVTTITIDPDLRLKLRTLDTRMSKLHHPEQEDRITHLHNLQRFQHIIYGDNHLHLSFAFQLHIWLFIPSCCGHITSKYNLAIWPGSGLWLHFELLLGAERYVVWNKDI